MKAVKWLGCSLVVGLLAFSVQSCSNDVSCRDGILGQYALTMINSENSWIAIGIEEGPNEEDVIVIVYYGTVSFQVTGTLNDNCSVIRIPLTPENPFVHPQLNSGVLVIENNVMTGVFDFESTDIIYFTAEK